jgi:hypothetical protein
MKKFMALAVKASFMVGVLPINGCSSSSPLDYTATIAEGRDAATDIMGKTKASSISIAVIDGERLVWAETFGWADKGSKTAPAADTMYCIETRTGEEWIRIGSYLCRPQETVQTLINGTVGIGAEGLAEWRSLDAAGTTKTVTITPAVAGGRWKIYNSDFTKTETGEGSKSVTFSGGKHYLLFHNAANVNVM